MTHKELIEATMALDAWFKSQDIEDKYAAVVMAQLVAFQMARNFAEEDFDTMITSFKRMFENCIAQYRTGEADEAKRLN